MDVDNALVRDGEERKVFSRADMALEADRERVCLDRRASTALGKGGASFTADEWELEGKHTDLPASAGPCASTLFSQPPAFSRWMRSASAGLGRAALC